MASKEYLFFADAHWTTGCESPGGKRDIYTPESRSFFVRFTAEDIESARRQAKGHLEAFKNELPRARKGSLSWQDEDAKIVGITLAQVLDFE